MKKTSVSDIHKKLARSRSFLQEQNFKAMVIGRKDNFAWFTCGGSNEVVFSTEIGFAILIITSDNVQIVAQVMDGPRMIDEELCGLDVEYIPLRWYEPSREEKVTELIKGMKTISDMPIEGAVCNLKAIYNLHYPLIDIEIERLRSLGATTEKVIRSAADELKPGMKETDIAGMLLGDYGKLGMHCDVLLIGSDERISKYRHPYPSEKSINRYVLLHPAVQKWGLHANITRLVHFGSPSQETKKIYDIASRVETAALAMSIEGTKFQDILRVEKEVYFDSGFPEEWRNHFQGGITGYLLNDSTLAQDPAACVIENQAFDWYITITGTKVEELSISTQSSPEVLSVTGEWPTQRYEYRGQSFELPDILVK